MTIVCGGVPLRAAFLVLIGLQVFHIIFFSFMIGCRLETQ